MFATRNSQLRERLQQQRRLPFCGPFEPRVPVANGCGERLAQRAHLGDARVELGELALRQRAHFAARRLAVRAFVEETRQLVDGEAEGERSPDYLHARHRQGTALAELGQAALTGVDPYILLGQACALVELTLGVEHARALEISSGGRVTLCSSIGSNTTFLHCDRDDEENESIALYVAVAQTPVTFSK